MKKKWILLMLVLCMAFGTIAYAETGSFGFDLVIGNKDETGLVRKDDTDPYAYVRTQMCTTVGQTGTVYVGYRVRTSGGAIATQYRTFVMNDTTYGRLFLFEYTNGPVKGNYYKLVGQVSDKTTGTVNGVNPQGRWTP